MAATKASWQSPENNFCYAITTHTIGYNTNVSHIECIRDKASLKELQSAAADREQQLRL